MAPATPEELSSALQAAINAGDAQAALELWDERAVIIGADGAVIEGPGALAGALRALVENGARLEIQLFGLIAVGDVALASGTLTIHGESPQGERSLQHGSSVVVYHRGPAGWRIAIDAPWGLPQEPWPSR